MIKRIRIQNTKTGKVTTISQTAVDILKKNGLFGDYDILSDLEVEHITVPKKTIQIQVEEKKKTEDEPTEVIETNDLTVQESEIESVQENEVVETDVQPVAKSGKKSKKSETKNNNK